MRFFSDNAAPVHPAVFAAMHAADHVDTAYDGDALSKRLDAAMSALFGREAAALAGVSFAPGPSPGINLAPWV